MKPAYSQSPVSGDDRDPLLATPLSGMPQHSTATSANEVAQDHCEVREPPCKADAHAVLGSQTPPSAFASAANASVAHGATRPGRSRACRAQR